jgi:hypothetical protein
LCSYISNSNFTNLNSWLTWQLTHKKYSFLCHIWFKSKNSGGFFPWRWRKFTSLKRPSSQLFPFLFFFYLSSFCFVYCCLFFAGYFPWNYVICNFYYFCFSWATMLFPVGWYQHNVCTVFLYCRLESEQSYGHIRIHQVLTDIIKGKWTTIINVLRTFIRP